MKKKIDVVHVRPAQSRGLAPHHHAAGVVADLEVIVQTENMEGNKVYDSNVHRREWNNRFYVSVIACHFSELFVCWPIAALFLHLKTAIFQIPDSIEDISETIVEADAHHRHTVDDTVGVEAEAPAMIIEISVDHAIRLEAVTLHHLRHQHNRPISNNPIMARPDFQMNIQRRHKIWPLHFPINHHIRIMIFR